MKNNIERDYLQEQIPYMLEKQILEGFTDNELKDFIGELYSEFQVLGRVLNEEYRQSIDKCISPNEVTKYFVDLMIYGYSEDGERYEVLKRTLEKIDLFLNRKIFREEYPNQYKEIDIHSIPIEDVIGRYTRLPNNTKRNIICPIHKEKSPSFKIYHNSNSFFCFGCNRGGNAINFIALMENSSTKEAFKAFANLYFK